MLEIKKIVLDVLKPLEPDVIEFTSLLAGAIPNCNIYLSVLELDKETETLSLVFSGDALDIDEIRRALAEAGASLHSIDEVEVENYQTPKLLS